MVAVHAVSQCTALGDPRWSTLVQRGRGSSAPVAGIGAIPRAEIAAIEAFALAATARQIAAEEREEHEAPAQISTSKE